MSDTWIWTTLAPASDTATLGTLLDRLGAAELAAWLEDEKRPERLALRTTVPPDEAGGLVTVWAKGRLFGPAGDLQWEDIGGSRRHYVLIGSEDPPSGGEHAPLCMLSDPKRPQKIALWGDREHGRWSEDRIPRVEQFYTPVQYWPGPYAAIEFRRYAMAWKTHSTERIVTRYLRFVPDHSKWAVDPRFAQEREER